MTARTTPKATVSPNVLCVLAKDSPLVAVVAAADSFSAGW